MEKEYLVENIKKQCADKGINISTLEKDLGFSTGLISRWVRMEPSIMKILAVADYLNVSLDELTGRKGSTSKENFVKKLYSDTAGKKLAWMPAGCSNPFSYPLEKLKELQGTDWLCGYCEYNSAFFLIACGLDSEGAVEDLSLYIIPDDKAVPVLQKVSKGGLAPLLELIREDITWKLDEKHAEKIKKDFLENK